ncbi:aminomethyl-transferring glycine dehydrogenase subunit GcvPB [Candidatus Acidulodesulfobacterium sp. H_13]|uniref:aminomethyl-transferring glycine dehydrogenase subunit GcvPB n=1 Tax=Candidatus Acidulodesulfobacterium sp. H_13 TaxID=3395470 RepID=UPI003AF54DDF
MLKFPGIKGLFFDEELLSKQSSKGVTGISIPCSGLNSSDLKKSGGVYIDKKFIRKKAPRLPEVSEPTVIRHFTRLSSWNMSVDSVFYPLGSCTMKYNPKINETIVSLGNIKNLHPLTPDFLVQPALKIIHDFNLILCELTGLAEFGFAPQAGAAGEFSGLKIIRKYFDSNGESRKIILIPDSSHGTNPASSVLAGFTPVEIKTGTDGTLNAKDVKEYISKDVAGIMITNPNTFGIFEKDIKKISEIMHENGSLVYMDGANFNAFIGNVKISDMGIDMVQLNLHKTFSAPHGGGGPGSGAIGVVDLLKEYLPVPYVNFGNARYKISEDKEHTIGRIAPFLCNFAVIVRAYAYLLSLGRDNISSVSEIAILNANYIKKKLGKILEGSDPFEKGFCMHECVFNDAALEKNDISTIEFAKLLIDYGFHPPTIYFPKNIHGAIMIEPTETESVKTLDSFIKAVEAIRFKIKKLKAVKSPQKTKVGRVNEVLANKHPIFK